jgi:hypothetical protein
MAQKVGVCRARRGRHGKIAGHERDGKCCLFTGTPGKEVDIENPGPVRPATLRQPVKWNIDIPDLRKPRVLMKDLSIGNESNRLRADVSMHDGDYFL